MPLLGNVLFLPIISILFDVFVCEEGHAKDEDDLEFGDSFMYRDCNEDCWVGTHMRYVIAACVGMIVFMPAAILTRTLWQTLVTDLHVFTRPTFYLQKSFLEVVIVMMRRSLRPRSELAHAVIFIGVVGTHLTMSLIRKPFSYGRLNLWFSLSMGFILIYSFVCILQLEVEGLSLGLALGLMFGSGALMAVAGVVYQTLRLPNYLKTKEKLNLEEIFKFAFNFRHVAPPLSLTSRRKIPNLQSAPTLLKSMQF
mmetsp:Transcript_6315/g.10951  ORF Transcript_6315/g.10951 Transcript_6315/m.10951 type:complete len:253 (-) Transcript_6315:114-872(-)